MLNIRVGGLSGMVGAGAIARVLDAIAQARAARELRARDNASVVGSAQDLRADSGSRTERQS